MIRRGFFGWISGVVTGWLALPATVKAIERKSTIRFDDYKPIPSYQAFRNPDLAARWCPVEQNREALKAFSGEPLLIFAGDSITLGTWREDAQQWDSRGWVLYGVTHFMILPADPPRERPTQKD